MKLIRNSPDFKLGLLVGAGTFLLGLIAGFIALRIVLALIS